MSGHGFFSKLDWIPRYQHYYILHMCVSRNVHVFLSVCEIWINEFVNCSVNITFIPGVWNYLFLLQAVLTIMASEKSSSLKLLGECSCGKSFGKKYESAWKNENEMHLVRNCSARYILRKYFVFVVWLQF